MTGKGTKARRCPVCGSRRIAPSLGHLAVMPIPRGDHRGVPSFTWRCRVCRSTMRPSHQTIWRKRQPIANWMLGRQTV